MMHNLTNILFFILSVLNPDGTHPYCYNMNGEGNNRVYWGSLDLHDCVQFTEHHELNYIQFDSIDYGTGQLTLTAQNREVFDKDRGVELIKYDVGMAPYIFRLEMSIQYEEDGSWIVNPPTITNEVRNITPAIFVPCEEKPETIEVGATKNICFQLNKQETTAVSLKEATTQHPTLSRVLKPTLLGLAMITILFFREQKIQQGY